MLMPMADDNVYQYDRLKTKHKTYTPHAAVMTVTVTGRAKWLT